MHNKCTSLSDPKTTTMDDQTESPPEVLPKNSIFLDMRLASGQLSTAPSSSLLHLIDRRERGLGADGFTKPQRYAIRNMHVPNGCSRIQSNDSSRQCIALSDTGNHFLTVSEYEDDSQTVEVALYDASRDTYRLIKRTTEFRDAHDFGLSKAAFSSKGNEFVYTTNPDRCKCIYINGGWDGLWNTLIDLTDVCLFQCSWGTSTTTGA